MEEKKKRKKKKKKKKKKVKEEEEEESEKINYLLCNQWLRAFRKSPATLEILEIFSSISIKECGRLDTLVLSRYLRP